MRVLFANIPTPNNRFMVDLKVAVEKNGAEVLWDCDKFWSCDEDFDVVHIHWPEYLSIEIESYMFKNRAIPKELWQKLENCLEYWSGKAKIVYTRHVQYPHARHDAEFLKLYEMCTRYYDHVVHFGRYSIEQYKEWYPSSEAIHSVIPHHNYESLPNTSSYQEARKKLGIDDEARVMLVFGAIKEDEKPLINTAFNTFPVKNKLLLAPGWKVNKRNGIKHIRVRNWVYKIEQWLVGKHKKRIINKGFVAEEDAQYYLNAADFLLIPRFNELNSGNITLGFTFGKVVIGRDGGDIGELLSENGNPTFDPGNEKSIKDAVCKALMLTTQNKGEANRTKALTHWEVSTIAEQYFKVFQFKTIKT